MASEGEVLIYYDIYGDTTVIVYSVGQRSSLRVPMITILHDISLSSSHIFHNEITMRRHEENQQRTGQRESWL